MDIEHNIDVNRFGSLAGGASSLVSNKYSCAGYGAVPSTPQLSKWELMNDSMSTVIEPSCILSMCMCKKSMSCSWIVHFLALKKACTLSLSAAVLHVHKKSSTWMLIVDRPFLWWNKHGDHDIMDFGSETLFRSSVCDVMLWILCFDLG